MLTCRESRALFIASWAYVATGGAEHLRAHGYKREAKGLSRAVEVLLSLTAVDVGSDVLGAAMQRVADHMDAADLSEGPQDGGAVH